MKPLVSLALLVALSGCPRVIETTPDVGAADVGIDAGSEVDAGGNVASDAGRDALAPDSGLCVVTALCDPFTSRPCDGELCVPDSMTGAHCTPPAATLLGEGAACMVDNECAAGLGCIAATSGLRCRRLCRARDVNCNAGDVCAFAYDPTNPCIRYCMPRCDLYTQDCPPGQACVNVHADPSDAETISTCLPEGITPVGAACPFANSCVRGAACIEHMCRQLCTGTTLCTEGSCIASSEGVFTCR